MRCRGYPRIRLGGDSGSLSLCYRCFYVVFTLCMCMEISYNTPAGTAKTVSDAVDCQRIAGGGVLANKYEALHRNGSTTRFEGEVLGVIASTPEEGIGSPGHEVLAVEVGTDGRVSIPEKPLLDDEYDPSDDGPWTVNEDFPDREVEIRDGEVVLRNVNTVVRGDAEPIMEDENTYKLSAGQGGFKSGDGDVGSVLAQFNSAWGSAPIPGRVESVTAYVDDGVSDLVFPTERTEGLVSWAFPEIEG